MNGKLPPPRRLGLLVNPIAGMGGAVGLKGTDGRNLRLAREKGAAPGAARRAGQALEELAPLAPGLIILAGRGAMGEDLAAANGFGTVPCGPPATAEDTSADDSIAAAAAILAERPDLVLFAGGDGTARDLLRVPGIGAAAVLGIPSGVKMHSGVFAASPRTAGILARQFLTAEAPLTMLKPVEILDRPEAADGEYAAPCLYGGLTAPYAPSALPHPKAARSGSGDDGLQAALRLRAARLPQEETVVIGPGASMAGLKRLLGDGGTLLGVDVFREGRLIQRDADRAALDRLAEEGPVRIIVSPTGGQGFLFGRGNQQIGPAAIRRAGREGIEIFASAEKMNLLDALYVDTGDEETDAMLSGYWPVITAPRRRMMVKIADPLALMTPKN